MSRLIDADKFILALMDASLSSVDEDTILDLVDSIPAVDAVPVVRCRGCKHCRELNRKDRIEEAYADGILWCTNQSDGVWPDDFCSYGVAKECTDNES